MEVRLLHFEDCPHWRLAESRLNEALATVEVETSLTYQLVRTPEEAAQVGFRGSPTVLIDGVDPFAEPSDPVGLSCRLYRGPGGVEHAPTVEQLRVLLAAAMVRGRALMAPTVATREQPR